MGTTLKGLFTQLFVLVVLASQSCSRLTTSHQGGGAELSAGPGDSSGLSALLDSASGADRPPGKPVAPSCENVCGPGTFLNDSPVCPIAGPVIQISCAESNGVVVSAFCCPTDIEPAAPSCNTVCGPSGSFSSSGACANGEFGTTVASCTEDGEVLSGSCCPAAPYTGPSCDTICGPSATFTDSDFCPTGAMGSPVSSCTHSTGILAAGSCCPNTPPPGGGNNPPGSCTPTYCGAGYTAQSTPSCGNEVSGMEITSCKSDGTSFSQYCCLSQSPPTGSSGGTQPPVQVNGASITEYEVSSGGRSSASALSVTSGATVSLTWNTTGAIRTYFAASAGTTTNNTGNFPLSGMLTDAPSVTTTYRLTAVGAGTTNPDVQTITVTVLPTIEQGPPGGGGAGAPTEVLLGQAGAQVELSFGGGLLVPTNADGTAWTFKCPSVGIQAIPFSVTASASNTTGIEAVRVISPLPSPFSNGSVDGVSPLQAGQSGSSVISATCGSAGAVIPSPVTMSVMVYAVGRSSSMSSLTLTLLPPSN